MVKKIHVVFGYMNSGSGSLTFPEDFDILGFYEDEKDAKAHCDLLNKEVLENEGVEDIEDLECSDDMVYVVESLDNLKKKK